MEVFAVLMIIMCFVFCAMMFNRDMKKYKKSNGNTKEMPGSVFSTRGMRTGANPTAVQTYAIKPKHGGEAESNSFFYWFVLTPYVLIPGFFMVFSIILVALGKTPRSSTPGSSYSTPSSGYTSPSHHSRSRHRR
jgi:hypothetical protein